MYRKVFTPTESDNSIPFTIPKEWYGRDVEIIVFPIAESVRDNATMPDDDFMQLCGAWDSELNADEMAAEIRNARRFNRKGISF